MARKPRIRFKRGFWYVTHESWLHYWMQTERELWRLDLALKWCEEMNNVRSMSK